MHPRPQIGKIYSSGNCRVLCTGFGISDRRFSGVVVENLDPDSDHQFGHYSEGWTWHPSIFKEHTGVIIIDNQYWKEYKEIGYSGG